jgi:hypothetical protein
MVLLSLLMLPNAVCFALGYLAGPGFAVGAGSSVAYGGSHLGALPAFPLLAGVPTGPAPWQIIALGGVALVSAGVVAGWRIAGVTTLTLKERVRTALACGAILGVFTAVLVGYAGGPSGPGRLAAVGPSPWKVGLAVAGEVGLISSLAVLFLATAWGERLRERIAARRGRPEAPARQP